MAVLAWILMILVIVYLYMIAPSLRRLPEEEQLKKVLYAHRGLYDNETDHPENTLKAFRLAVDNGYGIELDVQLTKDDVPVIMHDFLLARTARDESNQPVKGKTVDYTLREISSFHILNSKEKIPTLQEVLDLVNGRVPVIVEYKVENEDRELRVCRIASELLGRYQGLYCVESFNPRAVLWYRRNHPEIVRGQLSDVLHGDGFSAKLICFMCTNLMFNFLTRPDFIAYNCRHPEQLSRKICHGLYHNTAAAWTVKSEEELHKIRKNFDIYIFDNFIPSEGSQAGKMKQAKYFFHNERRKCTSGGK